MKIMCKDSENSVGGPLSDLGMVLEMQRDICYYRQFLVNVQALLRGKKPAVLINGCSDDARHLCSAVWEEISDYVDGHGAEEGDTE